MNDATEHAATLDRCTVIAPNGWRLEWDLEATPGHITAYNHENIAQWHLSGTITEKCLQRELRAFKADHQWQQGSFWGSYQPRAQETPGPDYKALG